MEMVPGSKQSLRQSLSFIRSWSSVLTVGFCVGCAVLAIRNTLEPQVAFDTSQALAYRELKAGDFFIGEPKLAQTTKVSHLTMFAESSSLGILRSTAPETQ